MKKITNKISAKISIFLIMLVVLVASVVLSACSNVDSKGFEMFQNTIYSHLVIKDGNQTIENFRLNYALAEWNTEQEKEAFEEKIKLFFDDFSATIDTHYKTTLLEKEIPILNLPSKFVSISKENDNIILIASFPSKQIWDEVSENKNSAESSKTETTFFTHTTIDTVEKIGSIINVGGVNYFVGDFFFESLVSFLQSENYLNVLNSSQIKNVFAYATASRRLKSDAESVSLLQEKYFHFWNLTDAENVSINFYYTYARVEVWYYSAIVLAFVSLGVVFLIGYFKKNVDLKKQKSATNKKMTNKNIEKI